MKHFSQEWNSLLDKYPNVAGIQLQDIGTSHISLIKNECVGLSIKFKWYYSLPKMDKRNICQLS